MVTERGRYWPDNSEDKGRFLSAGYHNSGGYYRDDTALMQLILDQKGQQEINRLWDEFDFIADHTQRTYTQWFFNNSGAVDGLGAESGSSRPQGHEITETGGDRPDARQVCRQGAGRSQERQDGGARDPVSFQMDQRSVAGPGEERKAAEPKHLAALTRFAERGLSPPADGGGAHRSVRPITSNFAPRTGCRTTDAIRDHAGQRADVTGLPLSVRSVQTAATTQPVWSRPLSARKALRPVSRCRSYSLANRLSYFLWSSMPDDELMSACGGGRSCAIPGAAGPDAAHAEGPAHVEGLATEFTRQLAGLPPLRDQQFGGPRALPGFTDDLREAMFQEPIRFVADTIARDGSVLDLLYGNYTFVNPPLAKHYGMPDVPGDVNNWVRVNNAGQVWPRRHPAHGRVHDCEFTRPAHQPGQARQLGGAEGAGHSACRRPRRWCPNCQKTDPRPTCRSAKCWRRTALGPVCASCHARFDPSAWLLRATARWEAPAPPIWRAAPVDTPATFPGGVEGNGGAGPAGPSSGTTVRISSLRISAVSCWPMPWTGRCNCPMKALIDQMKLRLRGQRLSLRAPGRNHRAEPAIPQPPRHRQRAGAKSRKQVGRSRSAKSNSTPEGKRSCPIDKPSVPVPRLLPPRRAARHPAAPWRCPGWSR